MKLVFRTFTFHIACILFFAIVYYSLGNSFYDTSENKKNTSFLDFILLATTIQAGIGFNFLDPISNISKIFVILQQLILISAHIITIYIFTL